MLKEPGGSRRDDLFDQRERALLRFTDLLTARPGSITQADLDELGTTLSEQEAFELVTVIATANWTNRFNDGLLTPLP